MTRLPLAAATIAASIGSAPAAFAWWLIMMVWASSPAVAAVRVA
jgi:hypothetical protein